MSKNKIQIVADREGERYVRRNDIPALCNKHVQWQREFFTHEKIHYVNPHKVSSYVRSDGVFVSGYWRDGDGDTSINRSIGYWAHNPFSLMNGKGGKK